MENILVPCSVEARLTNDNCVACEVAANLGCECHGGPAWTDERAAEALAKSQAEVAPATVRL